MNALREAVEGLRKLAVDALVAVGPDGDPASLGPLPDSVRVERFVAQAALLPRVDLVAHHCGSGTMLGALGHGLPQLALPHGADQFTNAQALLDCGAGRRLLPEEITADAVAEALQALLTESEHREAARGLQPRSLPCPRRPRWCPTWSDEGLVRHDDAAVRTSAVLSYFANTRSATLASARVSNATSLPPSL